MPDQLIMSPNQLGALLGSLGQPRYPNNDEITTPAITFKSATVEKVRAWRNDQWKPIKNGPDEGKFTALTALVVSLETIYNKGVTLVVDTAAPQGAHFVPSDRTIHLNKPSIITTLHEYGHALFGPDEYKACRWSVQLFAKVWPKSFANLEWNGHMLVKPATAQIAGAAEDVDSVPDTALADLLN